MEYASKATGGTALGLGIAGTAGWLLNGGLGNLFGGLGGNGVVAPAVAGLAAGMASQKCGDDANVSRYELNQTQTIAQKDMEIAYWRGQDRTARSRTPTPNLRTAFSALPARCARTRKSRPL